MMTAVVILDYKVPELLKSCIEALPDSVEVIIVDNNTTNRGFAAGCNLGIKQAIEKLFQKKVADVNTCNYAGKQKRVRGPLGRRPHWKKAIVTLKEGEKIDLV